MKAMIISLLAVLGGVAMAAPEIEVAGGYDGQEVAAQISLTWEFGAGAPSTRYVDTGDVTKPNDGGVEKETGFLAAVGEHIGNHPYIYGSLLTGAVYGLVADNNGYPPFKDKKSTPAPAPAPSTTLDASAAPGGTVTRVEGEGNYTFTAQDSATINITIAEAPAAMLLKTLR